MSKVRPEPIITPLKIRGRITRRQPSGLPVINLSFNESPLTPSPRVAATISEMAGRVNCYGEPSCELLRNELGTQHELSPDAIICGNGSEELLDVIGRAFAGQGDEIVIPQFGYIQFPIVSNRVGAKLVRATETDYTANTDALLAAVTPKTKIIFLANPNNPTGTLMPEAELMRLVEALPKHIILVIDLAYGEFAGDDYCARVHKLAGRTEHVLVTRTFSKAFGLAGLRVGWCQAPESMMPILYSARGMGTINAVAQAAALASLSDIGLVNSSVDRIVAERDRIATALSAMGVQTLPSAANFLLARIEGADQASTERLVEYLFDEAGILVNLTRETGLESFFRFSISLPEHNDLLLSTVEDFLSKQA